MSIQVVLNAWEQFEVQNPDIFALQWTSAAYNFFRQGLFSIIFVGKVAHTSLVLVVKISYQSKKLWLTEKHFSRGRFSHRCVFLLLFSLFFDISKQFCKHNESIEWFFFPPKCLSFDFKSLCSLKFFHLSRFRNRISPPNVFLGKFQHLLSTLKHYNLSIYMVKWPQIWFYTIYNMHTTRLYGWDFHNLLTFRLITLEKQGCFLTWLGLGRWGVNETTQVEMFLKVLLWNVPQPSWHEDNRALLPVLLSCSHSQTVPQNQGLCVCCSCLAHKLLCKKWICTTSMWIHKTDCAI